MTKLIAGLFKNIDDAEQAATELREVGYAKKLSIETEISDIQEELFDLHPGKEEAVVTLICDVDTIPEVENILRSYGAYDVTAPEQQVVAV
jgi:hypothetical protein